MARSRSANRCANASVTPSSPRPTRGRRSRRQSSARSASSPRARSPMRGGCRPRMRIALGSTGSARRWAGRPEARRGQRCHDRVLIMTENSGPVLIVGGGIGGLAAALALAQKGCPVQLLEQALEFNEVGAGIQLGPNVFRMFEVLGLTDAVSGYAVFPENLIMLDAITGEEVTRVPLGR